ncbi:hypothetical protein AB0O20_01610 [Streptomyces kronopolitis]|uniref:hypothetical protein n=1 Tax=Streptomyces kronopolitis TaxID=1612435 RepID=UPI003427B051
MTHSAAPATDWFKYTGATGQGLTEARIVDAQAAHNPTERHADGSRTITFERTGRTVTYHPATPDDVTAIRDANRAKIDGNDRLGKAVSAALQDAGVQMARWMRPGGSGVHVHTGGSWVKVFWWYATEKEQRTAPAPWIEENNGGVRVEVAAALLHAGFRFTDDGADFELTYDNNRHV